MLYDVYQQIIMLNQYIYENLKQIFFVSMQLMLNLVYNICNI